MKNLLKTILFSYSCNFIISICQISNTFNSILLNNVILRANKTDNNRNKVQRGDNSDSSRITLFTKRL